MAKAAIAIARLIAIGFCFIAGFDLYFRMKDRRLAFLARRSRRTGMIPSSSVVETSATSAAQARQVWTERP